MKSGFCEVHARMTDLPAGAKALRAALAAKRETQLGIQR